LTHSRTRLIGFQRWCSVIASAFVCGLLLPTLAQTPHIDPEAALKTCMAAQSTAPPEDKGSGPVRRVFKGLGKEAKSSAGGMAEGLVFVFSTQDVDPYARTAPKDKPYTLLSCQLVDGSFCSVIKYPDSSMKIVGGFADGTIIAPLSAKTFVVGYPNGTLGRLEKMPNDGYKIYRPDKTITTLKKTASGGYAIRNDKFGYMGEATPDRNGIQYEFKEATLLGGQQ
jgi:hypothetical protein